MDNNQFDPNQQNNQQSYQQPYNYQQPAYQQPPVHTEPPMSIGEWLLLMLIMVIPCVNIIMLFVWGFSGDPNKVNRANYCKAMLIWMLIGAVLSAILSATLGTVLLSLLEKMESGMSLMIF